MVAVEPFYEQFFELVECSQNCSPVFSLSDLAFRFSLDRKSAKNHKIRAKIDLFPDSLIDLALDNWLG